jgi:outer membrane protein assembly factor BamB
LGSSLVSRRLLAVASTVVVLVLGAPLAALGDWPQFQGQASHAGISDGPPAPLSVAWTNTEVELEGPNTTGGLSAPVVAEDGTIVVVAPTAVLGFSAEDGSGTFTAERDFGPSSQPAIADGADGPIVVFTEGFGDDPPAGTATPSPAEEDEDEAFDPHVNAVDLGSGEPAWDSPVELEDAVQTPVAVDVDTAYVGDVSGRVTAVDLPSGDVRWTVELDTPIVGAVSVDGDRAIVATLGAQGTPGLVVALDVSSGEEVWRSDGETVLGNLVSAPVVSEGRILVLEPGVVVALDGDGGLLWRTEIVNPRTTPFIARGVAAPAPVSADGRVFAVDVTGRVYALDAETGAEIWDHALNDPSPVSPPLLTEEQVLVPTDSGTLHAIDRRTGHLVFRSEPEGTLLRGLADAGEVIVAVTGLDDAGLVAYEADTGGTLLDEPSPTTLDPGRMLAGFALGALSVGIVAVAVTRPLQRRLGPALVPQEDRTEEDRE